MGALRIEKKTSDVENLSPPSSSPPVSGVAVPPPPAQLVAALAEYETKARDSFPSFGDLAPSSSTANPSIPVAQPGADDVRKRPPFRIAGVAIAAMIVVVALLALFLR